ncbi:MAG: DNA topoisomerase IV subunit A [Candidatus Diapherotrites archaeon]|nr:DNA topoisomerase IV subunit A [Candidatus Diapherotrites archaeon]
MVRLMPKSKAELTEKEVSQRLETLAKDITVQIQKKEKPTFRTRVRGKNNVVFDDESLLLDLGDKWSTRNFLNIGHTRKFMQTLLVLEKVKEYLDQNERASIREIYYELKQPIEGSKENKVANQDESNAVIVDLEHAIDSIRDQLNITADPKGGLYGDIDITDHLDKNSKYNCTEIGRTGWGVPSDVEPKSISLGNTSAKYLLVIETAAMFDRLVSKKFYETNDCLLMFTKGQAARGARRLIHRLHHEKKLPVIVFTDGDPYGWTIYSVIKGGSMALASYSKFMATPEAHLVGMTMHDIETYGLQNASEKLEAGAEKRAKELLDYPWFKSKEWQNNIKLCLKMGKRIEQQGLANKNLNFVANTYLPEKIENKVFLP